jgi:hypothetical protein
VSTRHAAPVTVTWNQVAAFRLAQHHLSVRAPREVLISVVSDMTGDQAQRLSAAQISLWARGFGQGSTIYGSPMSKKRSPMEFVKKRKTWAASLAPQPSTSRLAKARNPHEMAWDFSINGNGPTTQ